MSVVPAHVDVIRALESDRTVGPDVLQQLETGLLLEGADVVARWVRHEREGYGPDATAASLSELFGAPPDAAVVSAVLRARVRAGRFRTSSRVFEWPHFFVEPLHELQALAQRVGHQSAGELIVELRHPAASAAPRELAFPRTVFTDVVRAVRIELADVLRQQAA